MGNGREDGGDWRTNTLRLDAHRATIVGGEVWDRSREKKLLSLSLRLCYMHSEINSLVMTAGEISL